MQLLFCNCSVDEADELARRLVDERLAACVNIIGDVTSVYRWNGEIQHDTEATLLIKTTDEGVDALVDELAELHSYDVPEIVVVDPADVSQPYAEWVHEQVR